MNIKITESLTDFFADWATESWDTDPDTDARAAEEAEYLNAYASAMRREMGRLYPDASVNVTFTAETLSKRVVEVTPDPDYNIYLDIEDDAHDAAEVAYSGL